MTITRENGTLVLRTEHHTATIVHTSGRRYDPALNDFYLSRADITYDGKPGEIITSQGPVALRLAYRCAASSLRREEWDAAIVLVEARRRMTAGKRRR